MGWLRTAVLALVISFLVYNVPRWLEPRLPQNIKGHAAPGWNKVAETFRQLLVSGLEKGGTVSVYHKGKEVVRMAGGYADPASKVPWELDTLATYQSTTKVLVAVVIGILVDRHMLAYNRPVKDYWPEFAQNGKESITVEQLMSHQAGLTIINEEYSAYDILNNPQKVTEILARQKPNWPPGTAQGYHGITIGLYADQLVRRVDPKRRNLTTFFNEEVAKPFGIDIYIGLPLRENHRCARSQPMSFFGLETLKSYARFNMMLNYMRPDTMLRKSFDNPSELMIPGIFNNPKIREVPNASFNGFGTGQSMAKLGSILANGGSINNKVLMSPETLALITEPIVAGVDLVMGINVTRGRGVILYPNRIPKTKTLYGHPGMGGQVLFVDPTHEVSWSYLTNHPKVSVNADDARNMAIENTIYDVLGHN